MRRYACVTCGREVEYGGRLPALFPFCSPRCKLADLGRWLREQYSIERELTPEERAELPAATRRPPE